MISMKEAEQFKIPIVNPSVQLLLDSENKPILINTDTTISMTINESALLLWKLINNKRTMKDILTRFQEEFTNPSSQIIDDGKQFLDQLIQKGFIGFEVK